MQKLALFLNGEKPKNIHSLEKYDAIYCTDGAFHFLEEVNIVPDLIIGDFDSIQNLPEHIENIHTPDQNFTDFEKAIKIIIEKGFKSIDVFAANGMEQDHFLGNMTTALKYRKKIKITFYDDNQTYYFIDKKVVLNNVMNKKVSLFPFPKAKKVFSKGLMYPLNGMTLSMKKNRIGTRNLATANKVEISFEKGNILLFIEN
jgi:thiamine pyrophosphokinase